MGLRRDCRRRSGSAVEPNEIQEVGGVRAAAPRGWLIFAGAIALVLLAGGGCLVMGVPAALGPLRGAARCLEMYLPVANVWVNLPLLLALGLGVGVLSGMTGISGAFLLTPLLMVMGVPATMAVGTGATQSAGTSASGSLVHWRMGNVDAKLGAVVLAGSLVGGTLGVRLVADLQASGAFDLWVKVIYVLASGTVGTLTLRESLGTLIRRSRSRCASSAAGTAAGEPGEGGSVAGGAAHKGTPLVRAMAGWPFQTEFDRAKLRMSLLAPFVLGVCVGGLSAVMGVGGGFVMVPAMIYLLGVSTHVAVGTTLFQMLFMSCNVGFQQAATNRNVDVLLAVLLMIGAAVGSEIGGMIGRRLDGCQLRVALGVVVCLVMVNMAADVVRDLLGAHGTMAAQVTTPPAQEVGVVAALGRMAVDNPPVYGALSVVALLLVGLGLSGLIGSSAPRIVASGVKKLARGGIGRPMPRNAAVRRQELPGG